MSLNSSSGTKKRRAVDRSNSSSLDPAVDDETQEMTSFLTGSNRNSSSSLDDEVEQLASSSSSSAGGNTSKLSTAVNLAKCICGAGSFALPKVFGNLGIAGGTLAMVLCGGLAALTMQDLQHAKLQTGSTTYVQLARIALGPRAAQAVFGLTLAASLGVCSTYVVFIGQTLESLSSNDGINETITTSNYVRQVFPNVSGTTWEVVVALILFPLSCISDYSIFAFTSALGVLSVMGGIFVTLVYGLTVDPGWDRALRGLRQVSWWWPADDSASTAFGGSFGTIAYLFCINFLTFPIMNAMQEPEQYGAAVGQAVMWVLLVNVAFAIMCLGFYGDNTQDLVLANLDNGPYLSALKLLLCVDLLFTFPIVFSSGRHILEHAWLTAKLGNKYDGDDESNNHHKGEVTKTERALLVANAVTICLGLAQIGGFGAVANLVGGVAQGTLAFVLPPAIVLTLARSRKSGIRRNEMLAQFLVAAFGVVVVTAVTYSTACGMIGK